MESEGSTSKRRKFVRPKPPRATKKAGAPKPPKNTGGVPDSVMQDLKQILNPTEEQVAMTEATTTAMEQITGFLSQANKAESEGDKVTALKGYYSLLQVVPAHKKPSYEKKIVILEKELNLIQEE